MKKTRLALFFYVLICFSGCVQSRKFTGITSIRGNGYYAKIEATSVSVTGNAKNDFGRPNGNMRASGMAFEYGSNTKKSVVFSEFKARYKKGEVDDSLRVVIYEPNEYGNNTIRAYLIPERVTGKAEGHVRIKEMKKGKYDVTIEFLEDGIPRKLDFSFKYHFSIKPYIGPIKTWED